MHKTKWTVEKFLHENRLFIVGATKKVHSDSSVLCMLNFGCRKINKQTQRCDFGAKQPCYRKQRCHRRDICQNNGYSEAKDFFKC